MPESTGAGCEKAAIEAREETESLEDDDRCEEVVFPVAAD